MTVAHARFLPSSIVNRIIPFVENDLMLPVFRMMASDKSDQQNFYKIMCERLFPQMQQRNGYSWKDHYYRCLAYDRGNHYTKKAVTFLKDSTLLIGRVLAPMAAIKATNYFGKQYFDSTFYTQASRSQAEYFSFEKYSYSEKGNVEFNAETGLVSTPCPMYVSSEHSNYRSITPYLFQPKPNVKMEEAQHIYLYHSLTSDNDLIKYIANSNVMFSSALLGLTSLSSYFDQEEELEAAVVIENYLKLALSTASGLVLSSFLDGTPVDDLRGEMKNIATSLIAVLGLTFFSPYIKRKIIEGIHRILPNLPNIPDWGKNISISAIKALLFYLLTPDYRSWINFFSSFSFVGTTVFMGAFLGGGIASLPIGVMSTVAVASFSGTASLIKPISIYNNCAERSYETSYLNSAFSSVLTGCVTTGLLCSSGVTTLAEKVSNGVGNFFGSIAGTVCKAAVTAKIYSESYYSCVSNMVNRVYNLS